MRKAGRQSWISLGSHEEIGFVPDEENWDTRADAVYLVLLEGGKYTGEHFTKSFKVIKKERGPDFIFHSSRAYKEFVCKM
jgi:hypothetical protein